MKKVLFASTALVMTAGVASADVALSGSANMGLFYDGSTTIVKNEIDIDVKATAETDGGLSLGASMDLDSAHNNSATTQAVSNDPEVFVSYNGLTLTVGNIGEAQDVGGISDIGFDGLGVDDVVDALRENGSDDVRVDYAFGDIAVALSADSSNSDVAVSVSGDIDAFSFAIGFRDNTTGGNDANITVGYSAGAFAVNATYAEAGSVDGFGIDGSYTTGDVTITAAYAESGANEAYGIGVAYDLGGATLAGGIAEVNNTTVADLGISFGF